MNELGKNKPIQWPFIDASSLLAWTLESLEMKNSKKETCLALIRFQISSIHKPHYMKMCSDLKLTIGISEGDGQPDR